MPRARKLLLFVVLILGSWYLMQVVHEFGHMLGAWLSGGKVTQVELNPLAISRTDVQPNPHPLFVVWAGPIAGALSPVVLWLSAKAARLRYTEVLKFFAGFCLIANGAYIGAGSFGKIGDCGEMLRHGSPIWLLWLFGLIACLIGLYLWSELGGEFSLRLARKSSEDKKI